MKKVFALACSALLVAGFVSCGPSEEERKADSLEVVNTAASMDKEGDSIIAAMNAMSGSDSSGNAGMSDSAKMADSTAKAKK